MTITLTHTKGDWEPFAIPNGSICRRMQFKNPIPDSLIHKIDFLGYVDGNVRLKVRFNKDVINPLENFFAGISVKVKTAFDTASQGCCITDNKDQLKALFNVLKILHNFPAAFLPKIEALVEAGSVAPYKLEPIAYPGEAGVFTVVEDTWEAGSTIDTAARMCFKSENPHALIHTLTFLEFMSHIQFKIEFDPANAQIIERFLAGISNKIRFAFNEKDLGFYITNNQEDRKVVFEAIKANNTLPAAFLPKMEAIVAKA